ncbi:hypothetical protein EDD21DRAFT_384477 [Dissophora ornata]|nr:hypothetical protein EDD21DRAFT_384477 [Dissophora ornata]
MKFNPGSFLLSSVMSASLLIGLVDSSCPEPRCETEEERNTLWAHENPYKFWQCQPWIRGVWKPVERNCASGGLLFSYSHQVCVWPDDWTDSCGSDVPDSLHSQEVLH